MSKTDLNLRTTGSLQKPGPVGRLARLGFAALVLYYSFGIYTVQDNLVLQNGHVNKLLWNGLIPSLFLVNYIINIGYSRDWKKKPMIFSGILLLLAAGYNYFILGNLEGIYLAYTLATWEFYLSVHLGMAFLIAAVIGTPGCEMRAFHHLYSKITDNPTKEHICPVGPLNGLDRWEASRAGKE